MCNREQAVLDRKTAALKKLLKGKQGDLPQSLHALLVKLALSRDSQILV